MSSRHRGWWLRAGVVGGGIAGLTLAHFTTSVHAQGVHAILFKATLVPLVLAGLWFGIRGAALASVLTTALYLLHIFVQLAPHDHHDLRAMVADVILIAVMSLMVGVLSDRQRHARQTAEAHAADLRQTTEVLFRAEEDLRRADRLRALGELAAGMAHEIRNPLGGIRGAADILADDGTGPAAREEFREVLRSEVERLDRVVENFLDFARPASGRRERVDLHAACEGVLLLLSAQAEEAGVSTRLEGPSSVTVEADPDLLRQVILNVCLNGLQAMSEGDQQGGGGVLTLRVEGGQTPALEVQDSGGGIPDEILGRVFDPFVTSREGGTGLGLATSYRIMESLGGSIGLERTGPSGTTLRLAFAPKPHHT